MAKLIGKIVKQTGYEPKPQANQSPKKIDVWATQMDLQKQLTGLDTLVCPPPAPVTDETRLVNQAIYYIANDDIKSARRCLLATGVMDSWNAKCWCKEEQAVQRRNPEERLRYHGKPMPEEFVIQGV